MARRRRRRKFSWLPTQGLLGAAGGVAQVEHVSWDGFIVPASPAGTTFVDIRDVTFDVPADLAIPSTSTQTPMADFLRSGYMLRRVCGNVFVDLSNESAVGGDDLSAVAVTYAMFVARADENVDNTLPIGAGTLAEAIQNYGPQNGDNVREPFIFVKNWILGNNSLFAARPTSGAVRYPQTNAGYPGGMEGTFLDQKTLRRIDGDNRLWHCVQTRGFPLGQIHTTGNINISVSTQLRFLGRPVAMSRTKGSF